MIAFVVVDCGRCGFQCRAAVGTGVAIAYPDRKAWATLCERRWGAAGPASCADLAGKLGSAAIQAGRAARLRDKPRATGASVARSVGCLT